MGNLNLRLLAALASNRSSAEIFIAVLLVPGSRLPEYIRQRNRVRVGTFLRAMTIDVPFDRTVKPVIGNALDPDATKGTFAPGAPWTVCITPGTRCCSRPMRIRGACTS